MKTFHSPVKFLAALLLAPAVFTGCESTDEGSSVSGSAYYGVGVYDPWYYGGYDGDVDIVVPPPDNGYPDRPTAPPRPTHPIAPTPMPRPTPMPSIPMTPMPRTRGR
jgi:hypothetical protein